MTPAVSFCIRAWRRVAIVRAVAEVDDVAGTVVVTATPTHARKLGERLRLPA